MAQQVLHGTMDVTICEADSVNDTPRGVIGSTPMIFRKMINSAQAAVGVGGGGGFGFGSGKGWSDLYATIDFERARVGRTRVIVQNSMNPKWNESFHIYCAHVASNVVVSVKSDNAIGATLIGRAKVPALDILQGRLIDRWVPLCNENGHALRGGARVHVKLQFWRIIPSLLSLTPEFEGVPYTFFKQSKGCRVTLYHDAHVPASFNPALGSQVYRQHRYWEDLFDCISKAKHLVYITGWSVYTGIRLIRDPAQYRKSGGELQRQSTLGELLKRKANEGVSVLLLVWDDRTSNSFVRKKGVMATHDQETYDYFANTKVRCRLCPRNPDDGMSLVQGITTDTMFTHHQKTVVVDVDPVPSNSNSNSWERRRPIVAFVGGIDLCDGRYDTPSHSLFRTLQHGSEHSDDFHQPNFPGACIDKGGPREPWHDIHSKLEGPVAWDVLSNFEQRWKKQGEANQNVLEGSEKEKYICPPTPVTSENDVESWNVQVFRSIDGGAAFGFPEKPEEAAKAGLVSGKGVIVDRSIQDAYINAIRRANNFIYIENQYFLGSSFCWKPDGPHMDLADIGALHLIPKELSLKIVSKIQAGERFSVYIVVPMWPEGIPDSASVQAILHWQRKTMEMMYLDIACALRAKQMDDVNPRDYLTFFCLANREKKLGGEYVPPQSPDDDDTYYRRAQNKRRFMIYVHSKMMIVDDEYIIVGSANINQRSMDGGRDSEIAMGAYQPHYLGTAGKAARGQIGTAGKAARGQIHCFRMSLWYEHMGMLDKLFLQPQTLDCIRKVNAIAQKTWESYASEELYEDLPAHLLTYPVLVTNDGNVSELPAFPNFPDTTAPVLGRPSERLPPILTT